MAGSLGLNLNLDGVETIVLSSISQFKFTPDKRWSAPRTVHWLPRPPDQEPFYDGVRLPARIVGDVE